MGIAWGKESGSVGAVLRRLEGPKVLYRWVGTVRGGLKASGGLGWGFATAFPGGALLGRLPLGLDHLSECPSEIGQQDPGSVERLSDRSQV
jgi:hypothetical protein